MKVLFSLDKYRSAEGGADGVARGAVDALLAAGHTVRVLEPGATTSETDGAFSYERQPLPSAGWIRDSDLNTLRWNIYWSDVLDEAAAAFSPDLVLTQNRLAPASVAAAKRAGAASAILFHGYRPISPTFFEGRDALACDRPDFWNASWRHRLKWPLVSKALELFRAAYANADLVIANSLYVARVIERFFGREAPVIHPIIDLAQRASDAGPQPDGPVLFVKPQRIKGVEILLQVARRLPERRFLVAGNASARLRARLGREPNAEVKGWIDAMETLYPRCSLLFAPAQIPEPFGRVFVEAAQHGVPAVATRAGGIPEAVGAGGELLDMRAPPAAWAEAIERALAPERYGTLSTAARSHAAALCETHTPHRLVALLAAAADADTDRTDA